MRPPDQGGDLTGRLTCTVPEAGRALGIGKDAAYAAAERGQIPTLRLGRRLVVPVPRLLELLGVTQDMSEDQARTRSVTATDHPHGDTHDDKSPSEWHNDHPLRSA